MINEVLIMTKFLILGVSLATAGIVSLALKEIKDVTIDNEFESEAETARFQAQTIDMNFSN